MNPQVDSHCLAARLALFGWDAVQSDYGAAPIGSERVEGFADYASCHRWMRFRRAKKINPAQQEVRVAQLDLAIEQAEREAARWRQRSSDALLDSEFIRPTEAE